MKRFVLGDIHGAYRALEQVLERAAFDQHQDHLQLRNKSYYAQDRQAIYHHLK